MIKGTQNKWYFYRRIFKYFSWLALPYELRMFNKYAYSNNDKAYNPVFIIGLPRSGSTLLYQLVTDVFDVVYFDNLINLGRENIHFALRCSELLFKNKPHQSYASLYGDTSSEGLHAPAEAGPIWYKWFPKNVTEVTSDMVSDKKKKHLRLLFYSLMNRSGKPLVIKNLYTLQRMRILKEIFPDAKYIHIKRPPFFVAQSIYLARKKNLEDIHSDWWSVTYPGYESLLGFPAEKQIANQVYRLDQWIKSELSTVNQENIFEINYESLTVEFIQNNLKEFLNANLRKDFSDEKVNLHIENRIKVDTNTAETLQSELKSIFES